jgi:GINS complex subunit 3
VQKEALIMRYLDIDTLLCEEERVPCIFQSDAKNLAFLDSSLDQETDLPQHAKIELPLWLAAALSDRNMVRIEIPKQFGPKMRDELMADAISVNLREHSYYFFEVGLKLSRITRDDDLQRTLRVSFCGDRFRSILARSFHG